MFDVGYCAMLFYTLVSYPRFGCAAYAKVLRRADARMVVMLGTYSRERRRWLRPLWKYVERGHRCLERSGILVNLLGM